MDAKDYNDLIKNNQLITDNNNIIGELRFKLDNALLDNKNLKEETVLIIKNCNHVYPNNKTALLTKTDRNIDTTKCNICKKVLIKTYN